MKRSVLVLAALLPAGFVAAQPPGGPATRLYIHNSTKQTVVVQVYRPGVAPLKVDVKGGDDFQAQLLDIKDDRLLVISKDAKPWKIYDSTSFNSSESVFPTIGYAIVEKDGVIKLQVLYQGKAAIPPPGAKPTVEEKAEEKK